MHWIRRAWRESEYARTVVGVLVAAVLVWEAAVHAFGIRTFILPAPSLIFADLARTPVYYLQQSAATIWVTGIGFLIALVGGVLMAIGIVSWRWVDRSLYTLLVATNSVPKVALAPLFVIWLGTGGEPKIAIAALIAIFPVVINAVMGLRAVEPDMLDLARSARASRAAVITKIRFPNALPSIFAGAKVGISFALIGAIVGEFVAGERGLGYVILTSQAAFNTTRAFSALVLLGMIGTIMFFLVELAERLLLPWHISQRGSDTAHRV